MKKKKNNGNVLQITLILLLMLSLNVFSLCHLTILNSQGFQSMKQTNDIRLLKNILIANYKYENQNSILLSNYLELENYTISYTVDDMGDYFLIETRLKNDRYKLNITFYLELDKEKNVIKKSRINCYSTEDMDYLIFLVLKLSIHRVQDISHNHLLFL